MVDSQKKILKLFFDNPSAKLHLREIARKTGFSPMGASKILKELVKEKLVIREETRAVVNFRPNLDNKKFFALKRGYNLNKIRSSRLLAELIETYEHPETIVVFGSYASGYDMEDSDVDILIITPLTRELDLTNYEKEFKRKVNVHELKNLKKASNEFINNIVNGVVLYGYLKIK